VFWALDGFWPLRRNNCPWREKRNLVIEMMKFGKLRTGEIILPAGGYSNELIIRMLARARVLACRLH